MNDKPSKVFIPDYDLVAVVWKADKAYEVIDEDKYEIIIRDEQNDLNHIKKTDIAKYGKLDSRFEV